MYRYFTITTLLFLFIFPSCGKNNNKDLKKNQNSITEKPKARNYKHKITIKDISRFSHEEYKNTENEIFENKNPVKKEPITKKQPMNTAVKKYRKTNPRQIPKKTAVKKTYRENIRNYHRPFSPGTEHNKKATGGIKMKTKKQSENREAPSALSNSRISVRLKFAIRSGDRSSRVIAKISGEHKSFPEGTLFYGNPIFSNKRVYVNFTEAKIKKQIHKIEGVAITGRDPGIPATVTDISDNTEYDIRTEASEITGRIADSVVSNLTKGTTKGSVKSSTDNYRKTEQAKKKKVEYHVQAGMPFYVYIK